MAATPFKVISWSPNEPITDEKLDAMVSNDNWLKNNTVRGRYSGFNKGRHEGVRIAGGLALITARKSASARRGVSFGGFFSPGCRPIVTTGVVSGAQRQIFCVVNGPGRELHPNRNGFEVVVQVDAPASKRKITRNLYVAWHALGY